MGRGIFRGRPSRRILSERARLQMAYRPSAREVFEMRSAELLAAKAAEAKR